MTYKVFVDDNFHYMDEDERYLGGTFETYDEALLYCKRIVEAFLEDAYKAAMTSEELFKLYRSFGEDPFIRADPGAFDPPFSAWEYARQRCEEICGDQGS